MTTYDWLDDPTERKFLTEVRPIEILANAHRAYDWLTEVGIGAESVIREAAFSKAADTLGIDYDLIFNAWLDKSPLTLEGVAR